MALPILSAGSIRNIFAGTECGKPILQVLGTKRIPLTRTVHYRLILSDGIDFTSFAMLAVQLNSHVDDNQMPDNTIIRIDEHIITEIAQQKKAIIIINLTVLHAGNEMPKIGKPQPFTNIKMPVTSSAQSSATRTQMQQPFKITKELAGRHGIGIPNYGNTCYVNAVLQSIFHVALFSPPLIETETTEKSTISYNLLRLLEATKNGTTESTKDMITALRDIHHETIKGKLVRKFIPGVQDDAYDFLTPTLNGFLSENADTKPQYQFEFNSNGGTCWMKRNPAVTKNNAFDSSDPSAVCGVIGSVQSNQPSQPSQPPQSSGSTLYNVLATRHGAYESGACALPKWTYDNVYPVALGDISELQHLKFKPELCGHILTVDCGRGSLDIIINNSNLGGGLDLYGSTWGILTNNQPPGQTRCSVKLSTRNALSAADNVCFYKPGTDFGNRYYHNVGLLNTRDKIVTSATIGSKIGAHRGANPYFAFDGEVNDSDQIKFTLSDGSVKYVYLRDCTYLREEQMWS